MDGDLRPAAIAALDALVALAAADGVRVRLVFAPSAERTRVDDPQVWVWTADGGGTGISWWGEPTEAEEAARVADTAHEAVVEAMPALRRATDWPACPAHPGTHPLGVVPGDAADPRPRWACPRSGAVVAVLGGTGA